MLLTLTRCAVSRVKQVEVGFPTRTPNLNPNSICDNISQPALDRISMLFSTSISVNHDVGVKAIPDPTQRQMYHPKATNIESQRVASDTTKHPMSPEEPTRAGHFPTTCWLFSCYYRPSFLFPYWTNSLQDYIAPSLRRCAWLPSSSILELYSQALKRHRTSAGGTLICSSSGSESGLRLRNILSESLSGHSGQVLVTIRTHRSPSG